MTARVLLLYRHLVSAARQWPVDDRRPGRMLQPVLLEQTRAQFRANRTVVDPKLIAQLVAEGERALSLLRELQKDNLKRQFPVREQPIPDMAKRALMALSKDAERKKHPDRYGLFNRIKAIFTHK